MILIDREKFRESEQSERQKTFLLLLVTLLKLGKGNDASLVARKIRELFSNF